MLVWRAKDGFLMEVTFLLNPVRNMKRAGEERDEQVNQCAQGSGAEGGVGRGLNHSGKWKKAIQLLVSTLEENPGRKGRRELSGGQIMLY